MELPKKKLIKKLEKKVPQETPTTAVLTAQEQQKKVPGRPFQPGQSGNPGGRPPGRRSWASLIRESMQQELDPKTGLNAEQVVINKIIKAAMMGKFNFIELLWAYIDGRPNQPLGVDFGNFSLSDKERAEMDELLKLNLPPKK